MRSSRSTRRRHLRRLHPSHVFGWPCALVAIGALAAGCSGATASNPGSPYVVGATVDLSGQLASYGKGFAASWRGLFDAVNSAGGIRGHRVHLEILDNRGDPATQTADAVTLLHDGSLLVSGITVSDACSLLSKTLAQAQVPELCTTMPASLALSPPPYVFAMTDPETMEVRAVTRIVSDTVQAAAPRVASILPDVAGLRDLGAAFDSAAAALSWKVVSTQVVPLAALADVSAQVHAVLAAHPDMVLTDIASFGAEPMVRELRAGGFAGPVVMANADYPTMVALEDPELFQIWPTEIVDPFTATGGARAMVRRLAAQGVSGVAQVNAGATPVVYLGAALVARALVDCGRTCNARLLDRVLSRTSIDVPGLSVGPYGFAPGRNVPVASLDVYRWDQAGNRPRLWGTLPAVQPFPSS